MDTLHRGSFVESVVLREFVRHQYPVLMPFGEGLPYDLVVDLGSGRFLRIQCKSARLRAGCLVFNSCSTDHGGGRRPYLGLADVFGVVGPHADTVFLVPVTECAGFVTTLRINEARNKQKVKVRYARDYELAGWSRPALRELVEASGLLSVSA